MGWGEGRGEGRVGWSKVDVSWGGVEWGRVHISWVRTRRLVDMLDKNMR